MTSKFDILQMTSLLNEFIHVNSLPTKSYECLAYSKLFAVLARAFSGIIPLDEAIKQKPNAIILIMK